MTWLNNQGVKHPDSMSRKEKLQMIAAIPHYAEAMSWWLKHAAGQVSKKSFNKVRGYE